MSKPKIVEPKLTKNALEVAKTFVHSLGAAGKTLLFVGGKNEAQNAVHAAAERLSLPYVAGRWIGGTLSNFKQIRSRVEKLVSLCEAREKGELAKYTKMERVLIDRDIERLERDFGGLVTLTDLPAALFVVDPKCERIAVQEAETCGIPVIGLANSDCDISDIAFPIPGNDTNIKSIGFFVDEIAGAYTEGIKARAVEKQE